MTELIPRPAAQREDPAKAHLAPAMPRVDPITRLPLVILYPHSRCNCRCVMCDIWRDAGRRELAVSEIEAWLPEWKALGVRRVALSGGEPLMHSDLWTLCDALQAHGLGITVISTGLLLPRAARSLVRYCDDVVVSLDGPEEIHDRIRNVPRAFRRLSEGVSAVRAADPSVSVSGRCTVQRMNFRALRATAKAARQIDLDGISYLAADVSTEAFNRPGGWGPDRASDVALHERDLPDLQDELNALERDCADEFASGFIAESPEKLRRRLLQYFAALAGQGEFAAIDCNAPWVSSVIEADGSVRPCFFQPALGNIRDAGSLDAVVNSEAAIAWRRGLDMARNAICRRCVCSLLLRQGAGSANAHAADG